MSKKRFVFNGIEIEDNLEELKVGEEFMMTEKRFKLLENDNIMDKQDKYGQYYREYDFGKIGKHQIVDLLNSLSEENERLRKEKESWKGIACTDLSKWSIFSNEVSVLQETRDIDRFIEKYYEYCADMVMNDD